MAQPLFCTTSTIGAWKMPAKFNASLKSPSEVAPSPHTPTATTGSPAILAAIARPTACNICVAITTWIGRQRDSLGQFSGMKPRKEYATVGTGTPLTNSEAISRYEVASQSCGCKGAANPTAVASCPANEPKVVARPCRCKAIILLENAQPTCVKR